MKKAAVQAKVEARIHFVVLNLNLCLDLSEYSGANRLL